MSASVTDPRARPRSVVERLKTYVALTKPRIIELLLITTVPAMVLAARGWPGWRLVTATVIGGSLSAGGANAINNVVDRDIDARMRRTAHRPLPTDRVDPGPALVFGVVLGAAGFILLWVGANLLAAALATAALVFYVAVYTLYLKRTTAHNIVIGGAAGAAPVLVGWAAVTGSLALPAWVLFAVVFYWTPPHFWALSLRYREDYARAGVPMLPVVEGAERTTTQIVFYAAMLIGVTLLLHPAASMGALYLISVSALGIWFLIETLRLRMDRSRAMSVFRLSNVFLTLIFAAVAADSLISGPANATTERIVFTVAALFVAGAGVATTRLTRRPDRLTDLLWMVVPAIMAVVLVWAVWLQLSV